MRAFTHTIGLHVAGYVSRARPVPFYAVARGGCALAHSYRHGVSDYFLRTARSRVESLSSAG